MRRLVGKRQVEVQGQADFDYRQAAETGSEPISMNYLWDPTPKSHLVMEPAGGDISMYWDALIIRALNHNQRGITVRYPRNISGSAQEFVESGILRGFLGFLKSDVFGVGDGHAFRFQ
jgi:hypothetical protein